MEHTKINNSWKFDDLNVYGLNNTLIKPRWDDFFWKCLRQSSKKMLPHFGRLLRKWFPLPPRAMLIRVLWLWDPSDPTTLIDGGWGRNMGRVGLFLPPVKTTLKSCTYWSRKEECSKHWRSVATNFFDDCLRQFKKKSSNFGFINVTFKPNVLEFQNFLQLYI